MFPHCHFFVFSKGMTQECLCLTLWREVWWTPTASWCRATRSCQSTVRMSGRPLRRPRQRYSRFVWPSRGSEWQVGSKLCWMTLKIMFPVLQCCVGPIKMEVGRFKAGPFHSERRLSQSSQVINWNYECWIELRHHLVLESKENKHWTSLFQMEETGSSKVASQCSESGNLPDDPEKQSRRPDCKWPQSWYKFKNMS